MRRKNTILFNDGAKMKSYASTIIKFSVIFLFSISFHTFAGSHGKIKGNVIDKATGESIPGVNVLVLGTTLGAAADVNGDYFIFQVPPGEYELKFSMIGYQSITFKNVKVMVDLTTTINAELQEQTIELQEEVIVSAKRQVVQKDVTSSIQILGFENMEAYPVISAIDAVVLQTGVFLDPIPVVGGLGSAGKGETRYSIRGGEQIQIAWYLDGTRTSTLVIGRVDWGSAFTNVNINSVQEIQVNTGGFPAEYGNVQAAIINTITRSGTDDYHGSVEYIYGIPGQHHFGNNLYDQNIYYKEVNGVSQIDSQRTHLEIIDNTLPDGTLDPDWWTPYRQNQVYDYTTVPDHTLYLSFSGPIPFVSIDGLPIRFFLSSKFDQKAYVLPHPRDSRDSENFFAKFNYDRPGMSLKLGGFYDHDAHTTLQENGDFTNQAKYYRGWGTAIDKYSYAANLQWTHVLNPLLFYELKLSSFFVNFKETTSEFFVEGESENPTLFGFQRYNGYENEPFDQYTNSLDGDYLTGDLSLVGSLNWQVDKANLIKSGFEFRHNTYDERKNLRYPSFTSEPQYWISKGLGESFNPLQISFYLQDKMEFESMVLNIGVRYDYFNPALNWFDQTNLFNPSIDPLYDPEADPDGDFIDDNGRIKYSYDNVLAKPRSGVRSYHFVSPRIGVSFPITENTLLHFNYGHYVQMPPVDQLYEFLYFRPVYIVEGMIDNNTDYFPSTDGDPERVVAYTTEPLKPGKTIMFEVGVKHNFWDFAVLDVTAFYKDFFDQTQERIGLFDHLIYGYDPFRGQITPNVFYSSFLTGDYADSRGFEITLRSLFSQNFLFDINYSFSTSNQGRATPRKVEIDQDGTTSYVWDTDVNKRIGIEKSFSRPHIVRTNVMLSYPEEWSSGIVGTIFENTSISFLYQYISGQAFTYLQPDDPPDTYNNQRYPATQVVNLRFDKLFHLFGTQSLDLFIQVTNLFDRKNLRSYGDVVFDADATKNFVEDGTISTKDGAGYDISWQTYYDRRRIWLGAQYIF
jgi:outer membrane receptor for ferrienterochelin and colicin